MNEVPATVLVDYATVAIKTDSCLCNLRVFNRRPAASPEARFHVHMKEPPSVPPGDPMGLDATWQLKFAPRTPNWFPRRHQEKKILRPERPDTLDVLDASDATCLTRTKIGMAPCIRRQLATAPCVQTQLATASAYRTEHGRAFSFWMQRCQGIFLLDAAVSGHFPSGRSRVRPFSFWTKPCQGIFLRDTAMSGQMVSGRHVS